MLGSQLVHSLSPYARPGFTFCRTCGVRTYTRGNLDSLGGTFHAISVPALDLSPEQFAAIPVRYVNGRDGRYDETPAHPEAI